MFDLLKLIAKKEELQLALEGVAEPKQPNYRDMACGYCGNSCKGDCVAACANAGTGCRRLLL